ncbi:MAG: hypothetical protein JXA18_17025 [Chitinispirillaceae bacterium]|nr:hypothetical protein [Chitinispirillaceae bacterium]
MTTNTPLQSILTIIAFAASISSSPLTMSGRVKDFLSSLSSRPITKDVDVSDSRLLDTAMISSRPLLYEMTNRPVSAADIKRLLVNVRIADSLDTFAGYDERRGICYFNSPSIQPLSDESPAGLNDLKQKASLCLKKLLGAESRNFVFANTETDWTLSKPDLVPRRVIQTYRYTRKINGCHVVDNSAYVRIAFTGNEELCGFEIRNPDLQPVSLQRMVKFSATTARLEQLAAKKQSVENSMKQTVTVTSINAEDGIQSYVCTPAGGKNYLTPCVSVRCTYTLDNGSSFEKFEHFFIDASRVSNIDEDLLEPSGR